MKLKQTCFILSLVVLFSLLAACGATPEANNTPADNAADTAADTASGPTLLVAGESYSVADLEAMPQTEATFKDVTYVGVSVSELLSAAGYDLASLKAVKAVATDGYTVNYEPGQLTADNVIVSYAQADGPLTADDGDFRMVLPDGEGSSNLRMMAELQVVE